MLKRYRTISAFSHNVEYSSQEIEMVSQIYSQGTTVSKEKTKELSSLGHGPITSALSFRNTFLLQTADGGEIVIQAED